MKVVFLQDVEGVAQGGDVKEVKNGFARNYLLPKQLAVAATHNSLRRTERLQKDAEAQRLKLLADMKALAEEIDGTQVAVEMRAGASGRLYGSVTNAIVAGELSGMTDRDIDRRVVLIDDPIREVGVFDVRLRLHSDVDAGINVVVYPTGTDPEDTVAAVEAAKAKAEEAAAAEEAGEGAAVAAAEDALPEVEAEPEEAPSEDKPEPEPDLVETSDEPEPEPEDDAAAEDAEPEPSDPVEQPSEDSDSANDDPDERTAED